MKKLVDASALAALLCACSTPDITSLNPVQPTGSVSDETSRSEMSTPPAMPGPAAPKSDDYQPRKAETNFEEVIRRVGAPAAFDRVFAEVQQVPRLKNEFETTAQFDERQASARAKCASLYLIATPVDPEHVRYDADKQALIVATYALTNTLASSDELGSLFGYSSELHKAGAEVGYSFSSNVAWSFPRECNNVGVYQGSNAFGATVDIVKQEIIARGIFERRGALHQEDVWVKAPDQHVKASPPVAFEIKVDPSTAKALKENGLRAAVLVAPRPPFHAVGIDRFSPTIRAPYDRTTEVRYLIGDIQCAAIYDSSGKLLATRPTR
jgi:hypothetical protein